MCILELVLHRSHPRTLRLRLARQRSVLRFQLALGSLEVRIAPRQLVGEAQVLEPDGGLIGDGFHQHPILGTEGVCPEAVIQVEGPDHAFVTAARHAQHRPHAQVVDAAHAREPRVGHGVRGVEGLARSENAFGDGAADEMPGPRQRFAVEVPRDRDLERASVAHDQKAALGLGELDGAVEDALEQALAVALAREPAIDLEHPHQARVEERAIGGSHVARRLSLLGHVPGVALGGRSARVERREHLGVDVARAQEERTIAIGHQARLLANRLVREGAQRRGFVKRIAGFFQKCCQRERRFGATDALSRFAEGGEREPEIGFPLGAGTGAHAAARQERPRQHVSGVEAGGEGQHVTERRQRRGAGAAAARGFGQHAERERPLATARRALLDHRARRALRIFELSVLDGGRGGDQPWKEARVRVRAGGQCAAGLRGEGACGTQVAEEREQAGAGGEGVRQLAACASGTQLLGGLGIGGQCVQQLALTVERRCQVEAEGGALAHARCSVRIGDRFLEALRRVRVIAGLHGDHAESAGGQRASRSLAGALGRECGARALEELAGSIVLSGRCVGVAALHPDRRSIERWCSAGARLGRGQRFERSPGEGCESHAQLGDAWIAGAAERGQGGGGVRDAAEGLERRRTRQRRLDALALVRGSRGGVIGAFESARRLAAELEGTRQEEPLAARGIAGVELPGGFREQARCAVNRVLARHRVPCLLKGEHAAPGLVASQPIAGDRQRTGGERAFFAGEGRPLVPPRSLILVGGGERGLGGEAVAGLPARFAVRRGLDEAASLKVPQTHVNVGCAGLDDACDLVGACCIVEDRERREHLTLGLGQCANAVRERVHATAALGEIATCGARIDELQKEQRIAAAATCDRAPRCSAFLAGADPRGELVRGALFEWPECDPQCRTRRALLGEARAPRVGVVLARRRAGDARCVAAGRRGAAFGERRSDRTPGGRERMRQRIENGDTLWIQRGVVVLTIGANAGDPRTCEPRASLDLVEEAALADPDGAVDDDEARVVRKHRRFAVHEPKLAERLIELAIAAEERRLSDGRWRCHRSVVVQDARRGVGARQPQAWVALPQAIAEVCERRVRAVGAHVSGQNAGEQHASGVEVGGGRAGCAGEDFRGDVARRAGELSRGQPASERSREIDQTQVGCAIAILDQHVGRLDVAVNDTALVEEGEGVEELPRQRGDGVGVERPRLVGCSHRDGPAARPFLHEVPPTPIVVVTEIEDTREVRVIQGGEQLELARESCAAGVCGVARAGARTRGELFRIRARCGAARRGAILGGGGDPLEGALRVLAQRVRDQPSLARGTAPEGADRSVAVPDQRHVHRNWLLSIRLVATRRLREFDRCRRSNALLIRQRTFAARFEKGGWRELGIRAFRMIVRYCNHDDYWSMLRCMAALRGGHDLRPHVDG